MKPTMLPQIMRLMAALVIVWASGAWAQEEPPVAVDESIAPAAEAMAEEEDDPRVVLSCRIRRNGRLACEVESETRRGYGAAAVRISRHFRMAVPGCTDDAVTSEAQEGYESIIVRVEDCTARVPMRFAQPEN
jgi:hypothetical protein